MKNVWWAGLCGSFMVIALGVMVIAFGKFDQAASPEHHKVKLQPHALCSLRATGPTRLYWCLDGHAWTLTIRTGTWEDIGPLRFTAIGVPAA